MSRTPEVYTSELQLGDSATNLLTTTTQNVQKVIKDLSFFNTSTTATILVSVNRFTSNATDSNVFAERAIPPRRSWKCLQAIDKVISTGFTLSAKAGVANLINVDCDGSTVTDS